MSTDGELPRVETMRKRAIEEIMKLVSSQLSLERNQRRLEKKDPNAASRMHELDDTLEKLVRVAKKKGYLDPEATVESLKEEARARTALERAARLDREESSTALMDAMRKRLDTQTSAVTQFLTEREENDEEWEADGWAKLLNANQDVLVLMQRLYEKDLINETMIRLATLPPHPPARIGSSMGQQQNFPRSSSLGSDSVGPAQYPPSIASMMGQMPGSMQGMMPNGMMHGGVQGVMPNGMMPGNMQGMMPNWMMQGGMPGMMPNGMMHGGMPGMMPNGMMHGGMGSQMGNMGMQGHGSFMHQPDHHDSVMPSKMNNKTKHSYDFDDDSSGYGSEEELNEKLRELRGMAKLTQKDKKKTKDQAKEEALFKKNKGIGNFNNGFKVADDIRTLGAVPEDESDDEQDVVLDRHMALAMEERLLRGVEEELFREKKSMVKSYLKGDSGMGSEGGSMMGDNASMMQMSMMQQNMMQMQTMMQQMSMMNQQQQQNQSSMGSMMGGSQMHGSMLPGMMQGAMPGMMPNMMSPGSMGGSMMGSMPPMGSSMQMNGSKQGPMRGYGM